jgi:RimJ/RimL family protein N-acetyltransferase
MITLRAMERADAAAQHRWLNDPDVLAHLGTRYPVAESAIAARIGEPMTFANPRFTVEHDGAPVGWVALRDVTPESRHAELDLVIGEKALWGNGLGTETALAAVAFAFGKIGLHRVQAWVRADHVAGLRVAAKAGFTNEGVSRHRVFRHGAWHDCVLVGLLADDPGAPR